MKRYVITELPFKLLQEYLMLKDFIAMILNMGIDPEVMLKKKKTHVQLH